MLRIMLGIRWIGLIAVISSIVGSLLMFLVGAADTLKAIKIYFGEAKSGIIGGEKLLGVDVMVNLVAALDSFLFALILFYFAFGIYCLFIRSGSDTETEHNLLKSLPKWLQVNSLGQLKKSLLEVIIVLIAVLFLKDVLYLQAEDLEWTVLIGPISLVAIAIVLKLVKFEEH